MDTPANQPPATDPAGDPAGAEPHGGAPGVDRLLVEQLARLRVRYALHGIGLMLALPAAAVVLLFAADHLLRLPLPIRLFHTALFVALTVFCALRFLRYPLTRTFDQVDVALLLERVFPQLHQRLVSTVELKRLAPAALRGESPALVAALLADTERSIAELPLGRLFDTRRTRRVFALAAVLILGLGTGTVMAPATAAAFLQRHLGADIGYPRATNLIVELPPAGPELQRRDHGGSTELILPAGADLHVWVLAEGVVPADVYLDVVAPSGDTRSVPTTARPGNRFRHVFRRLAGEFEFWARGGDADTRDHVVKVRTIHPPQVAQIRVELLPPAYTRRPRTVQTGGAIEALVGTEATLFVSATTAAASATLLFLENGRRIELAPTTLQDDSGTSSAFTAKFVIEASDRYQVDLLGQGGLRNPIPGTYPISALQDYAPVGRWLLPEDESSTMLLPEGLLCVRLDLKDDFGLVQAALSVQGAGASTELPLLAGAPAAGPPAGATGPAAERPPTLQAVTTDVFPLQDVLADRKSGNDGLSLLVTLRDTREPEAAVTEMPRRLVQVVDRTQLAAATARLFRGLREEVEQAIDLGVDRKGRLEELIATGARPDAATAQVLTATEVGQGRIQSHAERVRTGLQRAFDLHLWNRLEPSQHAETVQQLYLGFHRANPQAVPYVSEFYREVDRQRRAGVIGAMATTLDPILAMIVAADELASTVGPRLAHLLAEAQVAKDLATLTETLRQCVEQQDRALQILQGLRNRLDEWNDFQDLIQETRALRDRQQDLQSRTEEIRGKQ
jgi:hypothetical protein